MALGISGKILIVAGVCGEKSRATASDHRREGTSMVAMARRETLRGDRVPGISEAADPVQP
jgi:hypothetical protein